MSQTTPRPSQSIPVYPAMDFSVVNGANLGDPISFAAELDHGDTYELHKHAQLERLAVLMDEGGRFTIAERQRLGPPGGRSASGLLPDDDGRHRPNDRDPDSGRGG